MSPRSGLTERVYSAILDAILDDTLAPGEHLVQETIAADLGVSRQPVQQAMALLKSDGLVEEIGTRGVRVARLDLARMHHHYALRAVLDGYGARAAAENVAADPAVAEEFARQGKTILEAGRSAIKRGSVRDQIRHDERLHTLIYTASANPALPETVEPHWRFLRRAMADVLRHAEPPRAIWDQHAEIINAISAGDARLAGSLSEAHVNTAAETLSEALSAHAAGQCTARNRGRQ